MKLVLASGSRYRQQRLADAGIQAAAIPANVDESPLPNESGNELAARLAQLKANSITPPQDECLIMGSDQVAEVYVNDKAILLGKPKTKEKAEEQLRLCSGKTVTFYTSLYVRETSTQRSVAGVEAVKVHFRHLNDDDIAAYIALDNPLDCAGSFKMEKAGVLLFDEIDSRDPNALIGMPLMLLTDLLSQLDYSVFDFTSI